MTRKKGRGRGWWGDSARHSTVAKRVNVSKKGKTTMNVKGVGKIKVNIPGGNAQARSKSLARVKAMLGGGF